MRTQTVILDRIGFLGGYRDRAILTVGLQAIVLDSATTSCPPITIELGDADSPGAAVVNGDSLFIADAREFTPSAGVWFARRLK